MIIPAKERTVRCRGAAYDDMAPSNRELWGDHVHHGLWTTGLENPAQARREPDSRGGAAP